jgi:restriction system protein
VLDDAFTRVVGRLPMSAALLLGAAVYTGVGLALPLGLGAHGVELIAYNVTGVMLGWAITLAWLFPRVEASQRRHLLEWTTDLRKLSAQEFEWLVGEVLRREGWDVAETGRQAAPDGNVDLRIHRGERVMLVQCKRWDSRQVGVDEVRKLAGTLMRDGLPGSAGMLVTLSEFTEQATAEATKLDMELVDGRQLLHRIEHVRASEPCPSCSAPMILDRSRHGWWLRCPKCSGKRDLGNEPARALGLLVVHEAAQS